MNRYLSLLGIFLSLMFIAAEPTAPAPEAPADGPDVIVDGGDDVPQDPSDQPDVNQGAMVDSKVYQSWTNCGIGTTVTTTGTIQMNGKTITVDAVTSLESKNESEATLKSQINMVQDGQAKQLSDQPGTERAKVPQGQEYTPEGFNITATEVGNETLTVNGQAVECRVLEFEGDSPMGPAKGKLWVNDEVPGTQVKMAFDIQGGMMKWETMITKIEKK